MVPKVIPGTSACCPFHDDSTPSLRFYSNGFHCFGCNKHGDYVSWYATAEGLSEDEAEAAAEKVSTVDSGQREQDRARKRANALRLWDVGKPIAGTLAAQYLSERRHIDLAELPDNINEALRFHGNCPFGSEESHPCLMSLMRDPATDEAVGIHRTALTPDAQKVDRKMLGGCGVVKLWPAGEMLVVGEGIETVLAAATRLAYQGAPLRPAWAALTAGKLAYLPIIGGVKHLIVLVDHDTAGIGAADVLQARWQFRGRKVTTLKPRQQGFDFNDYIMSKEHA
jgi:Toprim domain/CHC2 zinc finger